MPIAAFVRLRLCLGFEYSPLPASNRDPSQGLIFDNASDGWVQRGGVNLGRRLGGKQVDSTRHAAEMGDQNWRRLLDSHGQLARQMVERQRGSLIKNTGDGILATFDGPGRAVRCALAFSAAAKQIGLPLRSGLHTGEIEVRGRDRTTQSAAHVSKSTEGLHLKSRNGAYRTPKPTCPHRDAHRSIRLLCGSLNHSSYRGRLGGKDSVACAHFGNLGARALIHPALKLRAHYMILSGQDGVARFGSPCRHRDRCSQSFLGELLLRVRQELSIRCREIRGISLMKSGWRDEEILVRSGPIGGLPHGIVWRGKQTSTEAERWLPLRRVAGRPHRLAH